MDRFDKTYLCLFKVKYANINEDCVSTEYGVIAAESYTEAMEKIHALFENTLLSVTLTLNNSEENEELYFNEETYKKLKNYMEIDI